MTRALDHTNRAGVLQRRRHRSRSPTRRSLARHSSPRRSPTRRSSPRRQSHNKRDQRIPSGESAVIAVPANTDAESESESDDNDDHVNEADDVEEETQEATDNVDYGDEEPDDDAATSPVNAQPETRATIDDEDEAVDYEPSSDEDNEVTKNTDVLTTSAPSTGRWALIDAIAMRIDNKTKSRTKSSPSTKAKTTAKSHTTAIADQRRTAEKLSKMSVSQRVQPPKVKSPTRPSKDDGTEKQTALSVTSAPQQTTTVERKRKRVDKDQPPQQTTTVERKRKRVDKDQPPQSTEHNVTLMAPIVDTGDVTLISDDGEYTEQSVTDRQRLAAIVTVRWDTHEREYVLTQGSSGMTIKFGPFVPPTTTTTTTTTISKK